MVYTLPFQSPGMANSKGIAFRMSQEPPGLSGDINHSQAMHRMNRSTKAAVAISWYGFLESQLLSINKP
jgi:hypothetical protein